MKQSSAAVSLDFVVVVHVKSIPKFVVYLPKQKNHVNIIANIYQDQLALELKSDCFVIEMELDRISSHLSLLTPKNMNCFLVALVDLFHPTNIPINDLSKPGFLLKNILRSENRSDS